MARCCTRFARVSRAPPRSWACRSSSIWRRILSGLPASTTR
jgi:hypothetical protein